MIKVCELRNIPVICQEKQAGLLQSVHLSLAQKRVEALVISCGIQGKKLAAAADVRSLDNGFILVSRLQKYRRIHKQAANPFVRDSLGLLTGKVTNYAISENTLEIIAAEMQLGYSLSERNLRVWIYDYSANEATGELIVPSSLGSGLIMSGEVE